MADSALTLLILAAGKGTRMRNGRPKVLHELAGRPLIGHVLAAGAALLPARVVAVLAEESRAEIGAVLVEGWPAAEIVVQEPARGTGDAVRCALPRLPGTGTVLVLYGDTPLLQPATLTALLEARARADAAVAVLAMRPPDRGGYGRLVLDGEDLVALVEARHADPELLAHGPCNSGVMAFDAARLPTLIDALELRAEKGEYYLTDTIALARARGWRCVAIEGPWQDGVGVNSQAQLAEAEALIQARLRDAALAAGVVMRAPETVYLAADTELSPGAVIEPFVVFGPGVRVAAGAKVHSFSHLERAELGPGASAGPFARLRPGARVHAGARVGNFVEIKNAELLDGSKVNHLSYVGDATVGPHANVGAGTITCNYDGFAKHRTEIGEGVFIGSNTALVAPVRVGRGAITAAGSTITRDVPDDALAHSRTPQVEIDAGAVRFRGRRTRAKDRS